MASSAMLTTTATATETSLVAATEIRKASPTTTISAVAASSAVSATLLLENDDDECKDDDVLNTSLHSCANDPDFAVICAFLQKFAKELGLDLPNFKRLQEWLTNTDEVAAPIRDLHIKLLRKTRKTVHEKSWESAVSKFCFTYSAQDGWEVERFGYKQASLKVKLRILRELLESQFERNNKFRNKILTLSADSLRSQPIGRDRLGHSYWLTQDGDCNLRIYQEHLDEEIWQVVATNRDEFVNLITRLRGNEVVLPSTDIGVIDEDTSSSNSCNVHIEKPPPPVEQDDSQEEETKVVPNLRLKLGEGGAYHSAGKDVGKGEEELAAEEDKKLEQKKIQVTTEKSNIAEEEEEEEEEAPEEEGEEDFSSESVGEEVEEEVEEEGEEEVYSAEEDQSVDDVEENDSALEGKKGKITIPIAAAPEEAQKKVKPLLISQSKIVSSIAVQHVVPTNGSSKKRSLDEVDKTSPRSSEENNTNTIKKFRPSLLDSKRDKKPSKYEKAKSDDDDDEDDDEGSEEEDDADIDDDEGEEEDIDSAAAEEDENEEKDIEEDDDDEDDEVGEAIEDPPIIVRGEGSGKLCDGANPEFLTEFSLLDDTSIFLPQDEDSEPEVGEAIEEDYLYISGEGSGAECLVGNKNNEEPPLTPPATTTTMTTTTEPKATFFFGEPGCLKLSPIKKSATKDTDDRSNDEETLEELTIDNSANNKEQLDGELTTAERVGLKNAKNSNKNEKNNEDKNSEKLEEQNHKKSDEETPEKICEQIEEEKDVKITEALNVKENEKKEEKDEALGVKEKNNINAEMTLNENANHNHQSNTKKSNTEVVNDTNIQKINNKNIEPVPNIEPEGSAARITETVEFNGVGNNDVPPNNQEKKATERRQETGTGIQIKTKENETLDITKKADETNSKAKSTDESLQKSNNTEIVQENEQDNLNSAPEQEESTKPKIIIKVITDLAEKANNSSEETTEKLIKPKSTDVHYLSHNETFKKTSDAAGLKYPQTLTQIVAKPQKCALPEKTSTKDAPTTTASVINRKRRLADFAETQKPKMRAQTTSESEVELAEEPANTADNDDLEDDAAYIGGKRLKMRAKLTNTEIRKKVEAQKIAAVEETTSSSGEEEALRKRKIISPKRQLLAQKSNKIEQPKKLEKEIHSTLAKIKEEVPVQAAVLLPAKQKPTLAEIIEKKLKKTPEKPVKILNEDSNTSTQASLKKSPITKPLKKNLLTQVRQEESDEEAIPRKRIIGEIMPQNSSSPTPPPPPPTQKLPICEQQNVEQLARATPERITPDRQRKRRSSEEVQHSELTDHSPSTDCVGEKLKKNDADEAVKEVKLENELPLPVKRLESTQEETLFKQIPSTEITPLEISAKAVITETTTLDIKPEVKEEEAMAGLSGRRSGRRGGTAVLYAELPQPKRTRGGSKVTPAAKQKQDETKIKIDATETKCKEETLLETIEPQVKPEAKQPETTESKEATPEAEDTPADVKKPPTKPKPTKSTPKARGRKKRDVDTTNIIDTVDSETPVRQSRRIAQQKIREEAERRKLEEIALRTMKNELKKKKKAEAQADPSVPEPSEQSSSSDESDVSEIEEETKKLKKKKCPGKDGTWSSGSEEQEEPEEEEEPPHYETDPGSPLFRSDHEFSPESDLEDESQVVPMKRARTARKEDAELSDFKQLYQEEEACQKCGKSDHPEWILLCDSCDKGYHCSCLSPVLFYIPEGDWYCPPCQQEQLIMALEKQLQEFDFLVKQKRLEEEQAQRLAEEARRVENERLEEEKRKKKKKKQRGDNESSDNDANKNASASRKSGKESDGDDDDEDDENDEKTLKNKDKKSKKNQSNDKRKQRREVGGHRRRRRRAATRGARQRRRNASKSGGSANSDNSGGSGSQSGTDSESSSDGSSSSSSATDSDDEPIYKLRKRRQINVSYRLNEYDDLINSALKKEMDEAALAGNLGRGKDITTIIEADKEEQARQKQFDDGELVDAAGATATEDKTAINETKIVTDEHVVANVVAEVTTKANIDEQNKDVPEDVPDSEEEPLKRKAKAKQTLKKKPRKLTTLDISSEEDNASDEDFKGSSLDDDDDEDTSVSISSNSDSSLEIYKRRGKKGGKKKTRKAARRTARERRKVRKFVVDDSEDDEEEVARPKTKKKRKPDSDYTESEESGELSELSENMDSADLCDDSSSSEDSDGAWCPSKRKKQRKSTVANIARKSPKLKKPQIKKPKRVEYSDDDVSEEEEEDYEDEDDDPTTGGKGSGKQPRTVPLKPSNSGKGKGKGKGGAGAGKSSKAAAASKKKKKKLSDYDDDSFSDSEDSTRRTRGRRYAYLEDFEDDSSDGGIKPGVKRPDTPPEEREKFIKKQEEIKRMLAEKNAEGAKLAATPRLTPIKGGTRSPAKPGDSLSTVPLSVIRQAKVLDIDYLQRKGESVSDVDNVDDVDSEFDDADLPDDFPEDMDEDAIARMVEEEEGFGAAAAVTRELPTPDEVLKPAGFKVKPRDADKPQVPPATNASLVALSQMPSNAGIGQPMTSASGLQEPMRKRLPMPTMHPPLLRHQYPGGGQHHHSLPPHMMQRHAGPPTHLLQNALSAPLGQPVHRNFPQQAMGAQRGPPGGGMAPRHGLPPHALPPPQQQLTASHPLTSGAGEAEQKPRGRRKKITPLRDPLQKQQAAAAATAAAAVQAATTGNASDKRETSPPTSVATGVIKTATSLAIAQPPQLYKPTGAGSSVGQPSVITRMPHLPPHGAPPGRGMPLGPPGMYAGGDVARFYGPPMQQPSGAPGSRMPPTSSQRHRGPPHVGSMPPHHGMRPSYGPPPPLRGVIGSSNQSPLNSVSGTRPPYPPPPNRGEHHGPQSAGPYGPPPPARHATSHINPYRPSIFGNPNYGPRGAPPGASMRTTGPPGQEYTAGPPRSYAPYGYYPPPPPLTAAHPPQPSTHPPPSTTHVPPTSKPLASTTRISTSNTQPPAVPSSVIVSAPSSSLSLTPSAAAAQKHASRAVIKTAPAVTGPNKSTPAAVVSPSATIVEPRKKLITLETFATSKSPLALSGESSGSRSSPNVHPDGADDSTSTPAAATSGGNGQGASEFSGLVSYFSSQHDDYNT